MRHSYVILSDSRDDVAEIKAVTAQFPQLSYIGVANNYNEGLELILETSPSIVFLEVQPNDLESRLSFALVNELYRYLTVIPKIIITAKNTDLAYEAIKHDCLDYLLLPFRSFELRKTILRYEKMLLPGAPQVPMTDPIKEIVVVDAPTSDVVEEPTAADPEPTSVTLERPTIVQVEKEKPLIVCVKSYGDYRFIEAKDIRYLQAVNNSTDIHLVNGEMITAFKTLKHFEGLLSSPFVRIHNSYIVNIDYVSRIHTGNAVCYIKNTSTKLPFSKSYKENVDAIINSITNGNYLEI